MATYLLSPASDFRTGQVMYVDGGYIAGGSASDSSRSSGVSTGIGRGTSPKHVAVAIIEDQNATHNRAGMTISPRRFDHYQRRCNNV